jgi:hypothetical protein
VITRGRREADERNPEGYSSWAARSRLARLLVAPTAVAAPGVIYSYGAQIR